jgi:hypothetical protein
MKTFLASELSSNQLIYTAWNVRATQVSLVANSKCEQLVAHLLDSEILTADDYISAETPPAYRLC